MSCSNGIESQKFDDWRVLACDPGTSAPALEDNDEWGITRCYLPEIVVSQFDHTQLASAYSSSPSHFSFPVFTLMN